MIKLKIKSLSNINLKTYTVLIILLLFLTDLTIIWDIFLLRQILGFLYFTIVPGLLILQILRLYELEFSKKFVLSVGLSISSIMFVGLVLNCLYPLIKRPLSFYPILTSLNIFVIVLTILTYWRNKKDFSLSYLFNYKIDIEGKYISPMLVSFLFPFLSIFGTYLMNIKGDNIVLLIMLFLIPIYVGVFIYLKDKIPEVSYLVAIWMVGLSVALMYGLRSDYVSLSDGCLEYYLFQLTLKSSHWMPLHMNIGAIDNYSVCLSVTILPTIYKFICDLQSFYIYKVIYNIFLSMVPLVAFIIFNKIFKNNIIAFVSAFFFISQYPYISMIGWIIFRQIIAVLFFALIILILFESISNIIKQFLFIIFVVSMVVSHYSTAYIFFILMFLYYILSLHIKNTRINKDKIAMGITGTTIILIFTLIFLWYGQISSSAYSSFIEFLKSAFLTFTGLSLKTFEHSKEVFLEAKNIGFAVTKCIYEISLICITVGVISYICNYSRNNNKSFRLLVFVSFSILVPLVFIGEILKSKYGYDRVYQQLLFFLAPAYVFGVHKISKSLKINNYKNIFLIILISLQFFSSTYIILQIFGVHHSEVLNNDGIRYDTHYIKNMDYTCAKWIYNYGKKETTNVWGDYPGKYIYSQFDPKHAKCLYAKMERVRGYIYLRFVNTLNGYIYLYKSEKETITLYMKYLLKMNRIYDNGAVVYSY